MKVNGNNPSVNGNNPVRRQATTQQTQQTQQPQQTQQTRQVGNSGAVSNNNTQTRRSAQADPVDARVQFGARGGFNVDQAISDLRSKYVVNGKVPASKTEQLQNDVDALFNNPAARRAMIDRYDLDSQPNKDALVAVTAVESGSNGDMGEVMTTVMNRTLAKNLMSEMTGKPNRFTVLNTINERGQFSSSGAVARILSGRDTPSRHGANFGPAAREVMAKVLNGQTTFRNNASETYFFNQGGFSAGTDYRIGVHRFSDRNTSDTSYVSALLHSQRSLNWNR